jgi:transposase-like protein
MEHVVRQYSPELKQRIVDELEAGHLSLREAARDTRATVAMVQKWVAEYGRYRPKRDVLEVVMKSEQERIAALEKALAEAHLQLQVYDELIHQANKRYKLDLKKTFGSPSLTPAVPTPPSRSGPSAPSSASRATHTTSGDSAPAVPSPARSGAIGSSRCCGPRTPW